MTIAVAVAFVGAMILTRFVLRMLLAHGLLRRRVVLVENAGDDGQGREWIRQDDQLDIVAVQMQRAGMPDAGSPDVLSPSGLRAMNAWAVILAQPADLDATVQAAIARSGVRLYSEASFFECRYGCVNLARLPADWLTSSGSRDPVVAAVLRRAFDIILSLIVLLATLPLTLMAALAIRLDSPGPVFYRQERVGRGGRVFTLLKFRSMVTDAEPGGTARWAMPSDPRVTRVGRFLRLTRIDEIPQVINVLRGDMAFIGPRPERPAFVEQLSRMIPHYEQRVIVKPGITGWAQVSCPYGASVDDARKKLSYDFYYIERRSLFLDLLILIATVRVVLFQEGSR